MSAKKRTDPVRNLLAHLIHTKWGMTRVTGEKVKRCAINYLTRRFWWMYPLEILLQVLQDITQGDWLHYTVMEIKWRLLKELPQKQLKMLMPKHLQSLSCICSTVLLTASNKLLYHGITCFVSHCCQWIWVCCCVSTSAE